MVDVVTNSLKLFARAIVSIRLFLFAFYSPISLKKVSSLDSHLKTKRGIFLTLQKLVN
jgi:hypothetical protein